MPFVAISKTTGARIDITTIQNPRDTLKADSLVCQLCDAPMIVVAGSVRAHHFRHMLQCSSDYGSHPESYEHLYAKYFIRQHLSEFMAEYSNATGELEVKIPEARRVADILFTFPGGWRVAHEVQLASITTEKLEQRTDDYLGAGIDTVWWLGRQADTHQNRLWCVERFGFVLQVNFANPGPIDVFTQQPIYPEVKTDAFKGL